MYIDQCTSVPEELLRMNIRATQGGMFCYEYSIIQRDQVTAHTEAYLGLENQSFNLENGKEKGEDRVTK